MVISVFLSIHSSRFILKLNSGLRDNWNLTNLKARLSLLAFFILISTTFLIAIREKNEIKKLISVGFGSWIFFHTVINLGGAVGIVPITGIVLPFVSYGSSAMISIFIALGIMYSRDYE